VKPEIKAALNQIGFAYALGIDRSLAFHVWKPSERGSKLYSSKPEAGKARKAFDALAEDFADLPDRCWELLDQHSRSSEDWDNSRNPLSNVILALVDLRHMTEAEVQNAWDDLSRGSSRQHAANETAAVIAKIYVLGKGEMPGSGSDHLGRPSGDYAKTVDTIFNLAGYSDNYRAPCDRAVKWLKANNRREFNKFMHMRATGGRRISIVAGQISK
jgi:hypothetical protein